MEDILLIIVNLILIILIGLKLKKYEIKNYKIITFGFLIVWLLLTIQTIF